MTDTDIDSMHLIYKDIFHSIVKETYIEVSNRSVMFWNLDTWAILLILAIDKIAYEDGNIEISKKALSGVSSMRRRFYLDIFWNFHNST